MRYMAVLLAALMSAPLAVFAAPPEPKPDDMVNNPPYSVWSAFPRGTSVTQKETVSLPGGTKIRHVMTSKLVEKTKEKVVVETTVKVTETGGVGMVESTKTRTTFPAKVKMSQADTPDSALSSITEGKEQVEVKGKKVTAEWVEAVSKSGDEVTIAKVWRSRDIPGGVIKETIIRKKGDKVLSESLLELVDHK